MQRSIPPASISWKRNLYFNPSFIPTSMPKVFHWSIDKYSTNFILWRLLFLSFLLEKFIEIPSEFPVSKLRLCMAGTGDLQPSQVAWMTGNGILLAQVEFLTNFLFFSLVKIQILEILLAKDTFMKGYLDGSFNNWISFRFRIRMVCLTPSIRWSLILYPRRPHQRRRPPPLPPYQAPPTRGGVFRVTINSHWTCPWRLFIWPWCFTTDFASSAQSASSWSLKTLTTRFSSTSFPIFNVFSFF